MCFKNVKKQTLIKSSHDYYQIYREVFSFFTLVISFFKEPGHLEADKGYLDLNLHRSFSFA